MGVAARSGVAAAVVAGAAALAAVLGDGHAPSVARPTRAARAAGVARAPEAVARRMVEGPQVVLATAFAKTPPLRSLPSVPFSEPRAAERVEPCGAPTAVAVTGFRTRRTSAGVAVSWRTGTEAGIAGFDVWRTGRAGATRKVNASLIPATRAASARGAAYGIVDRLVKSGAFATYRLQIVDLEGRRTWYGTGSTPTPS